MIKITINIVDAGSGPWIALSNDWRRLHSWSPNSGLRDLFWYQQELGEYEDKAILRPDAK